MQKIQNINLCAPFKHIADPFDCNRPYYDHNRKAYLVRLYPEGSANFTSRSFTMHKYGSQKKALLAACEFFEKMYCFNPFLEYASAPC